MQLKALKIKNIPDKPGVYFFLGAQKDILYIGKATSLKNRIRSYFDAGIDEKRSPIIAKMVFEAKSVDYTVTDSVLEALILETNLIRTHKPRFNTRSKDDKSYNHLIITNEEFPRVLVVRGKDLSDNFKAEEIKYEFGPFPSGSLFKEALKIVRKLFKFYDTKKPIGKEKDRLARGKIDFNKQIGLYPDKVSKQTYQKTIRHIKLFFEGKKQKVIKELEKEMMDLAKNEQFEEANEIKKRIFALQHIQDVSLIKSDKSYRSEDRIRIEAYDIAHLQGSNMVGVMCVIEGGELAKSEYRKFKIKSFTSANDPGALREVIDRRLNHDDWPKPQLIVADGAVAQKNALERVLKEHNLVIPVVAVVKDDRHKPIKLLGQKTLIDRYKDQILLANAESHRFALAYHKSKRKLQTKA